MDFNTGNQGDHNAIPEQIRTPIQPEPPVPHPPEVPEIKDVEKKGNSVIVQSPIEVVKKNKVLNDVPHNPVNVRTNRTGDSERIRQAALDINSKEEVHNLARFPSRSNESIVLLVMVHKRLEYLRYLINSLRKVRGIGDALIIFSHDYYDEEINALIKTVDFCQVQIIFVFFSAFTFLNALFPLFSSFSMRVFPLNYSCPCTYYSTKSVTDGWTLFAEVLFVYDKKKNMLINNKSYLLILPTWRHTV